MHVCIRRERGDKKVSLIENKGLYISIKHIIYIYIYIYIYVYIYIYIYIYICKCVFINK